MADGRMLDSIVTVPDVLVIHETALGVLCEVSGRPTFVGRLQLAIGAMVPHPGERGPLTLTRAAARELGLESYGRRSA